MNYEEAFRHYREGTATDEEKAFVLDELAKAKALSSLLDDEGLAVKRAPIKEAEAKDVKEAKHDLVWKRVLAGLIAIAVIVVVIGAVLGGVFGAAAAYGRDNILLDRAEAIAVAEEFARSDAASRKYTPDRVITDLPQDVEDKFNFETDLRSSYYSYEVDVTVWTAEGYELDYEVVVNTHTGSPSLKELHRPRRLLRQILRVGRRTGRELCARQHRRCRIAAPAIQKPRAPRGAFFYPTRKIGDFSRGDPDFYPTKCPHFIPVLCGDLGFCSGGRTSGRAGCKNFLAACLRGVNI